MRLILRKFLNTLYGFRHLLRFLIYDLHKLKKSECVFFFPYYHTGGAERVHVDILNAVQHKNCTVVFTMGSATTNFYNSFKSRAQIIELNSILNKKNRWITNKLHETIVNSLNENGSLETIFGSNTSYYYNIILEVKSSVQKIDLLHAFEENDSKVLDVIKSVKIINKRIVINEKAKNDIIGFYKLYGIESEYIQNIEIIQNGINSSANEKYLLKKEAIKIGFVGRWSDEKRPSIFLDIAKIIKKESPYIEFVMAGRGMKSNLELINDAGVVFLGEITDKDQMATLYDSLHFILITSVYEGFPMVIMEAMSHGVIPIATNVGGISEHIEDNNNGYLINETDEISIINLCCEKILNVISDPIKKRKISKSAFDYAIENFGIQKFNKSYKKIFFKT